MGFLYRKSAKGRSDWPRHISKGRPNVPCYLSSNSTVRDTTELRSDLSNYGIQCTGEIRGTADIGQIIPELVDDNLKRRFIAGLADTIGSMAKSQRRFSAEHQILSFEIKGYNFKFVCDLCRLLYSVNCIPDQINWNHPNIHCPSDPYYGQWNKGFKLRILLDQYSEFGAFAFRTKAETSAENRQLQQETHYAERCEDRRIVVKPSTVHPAEHDMRLPEEIRGGHYIHFRQFCAALGCEHAPYDKLEPCFHHLGEYIIPFPILSKDSLPTIINRVNADPLMSNRNYRTSQITVQSLLAIYQQDPNSLLYGSTPQNGYPIAQVMQAIAYVIADNDELFGRRPKNYEHIIERHLSSDPNTTVEVRIPDLLTPLIIAGNGRGALVGAVNPTVYERLIERSRSNPYKLIVRSITERDLQNAQ